jgi:hypothetical protein
MTDRRWKPVGGIDKPFVNMDREIIEPRAAITGRQAPEFVPYVWRDRDKARRDEVDARLRAVRERLGFEEVTGWYEAEEK